MALYDTTPPPTVLRAGGDVVSGAAVPQGAAYAYVPILNAGPPLVPIVTLPPAPVAVIPSDTVDMTAAPIAYTPAAQPATPTPAPPVIQSPTVTSPPPVAAGSGGTLLAAGLAVLLLLTKKS